MTRTGGWLKTNEFSSLVRPLALLLVLTFTLSSYANAAIAAGSQDILCISAQAQDNQNGNSPSRRAVVDHCALCTIATAKTDATENNGDAIILYFERHVFTLLASTTPAIEIASRAYGARAPPFS